MEKFNVQDFKELMSKASDLTDATQKVKPLFENVPNKFRDFASKTMNVLGATASVSFSSLAELNVKDMKEMVKRTSKANPLNIDNTEKEENKNIPLALNWIVKLLKGVIEKLEEHGNIIRVHNDVLANPEAVIDIARPEIEALKKENEKLKIEIDETRQRGMKGNILVSCPVKNGQTRAGHSEVTEGENKRLENDTEMVIRLILDKTGVKIPIADVVACHPMGQSDKHTYVIRIMNRRPGSAWERLTAIMMKATSMEKTVNVYLNFQLTEKRAALAKSVRTARSEGKIAGYSVDQNGKIKIKKIGGTRYDTTVKSVEQLNSVITN